MTTRAVNRSAAQWTEIIAQYQAGQETERAFCERQGFKLGTFRKWRYQLTKANRPARRARSKPGFVQVSAQAPLPNAYLTIHSTGGVRIDCPLQMGVESIASLALAVQDER